ncbi:MAG: transposase, partial [Elusimicrobia bacterium]|nr:transposase [Elusimicrobiota bacterium]
EPVFGQIKQAMGFRRYFYRGMDKARSEWNLVCAALNLGKLARVLTQLTLLSYA